MKPALPVGAAVKPVAEAVLLACQQAWVGCDADVQVWEKSRRIGASWSTASKAVLCASAKKGSDALYIGYSEDMTREFIDDCAMWAKHFNDVIVGQGEFMFADTDDAGDTQQIKAFRIDFASGFKILALSSRPRSIRGKQGLVIIDEAAFHDDFPGLMKAALAMLVWGGRVLVISSHNGEDNPFNLLIKDIRAGKVPYSLFRTTFRDAINDGLYRRVCLRKGLEWSQQAEDEYVAGIYSFYGDGAAEELDCIPAAGSGVYLPRTIVERCQDATIPILRFKQPPEFVLATDRLAITEAWFRDQVRPVIDALPQDKRTVFGQDFGRSGDLSAATPLQEVERGRWRQCFSLEMRNIPFDCQQKLIFLLMDYLPLLHHAKFDSRGNGQSHAEAALQKYGPHRVEMVMLSLPWYAEYFPKYKAALEDRSIAIAPGEDIIADHRRVILDKGRPKMDEGKDKGSDGGQRHGDTAVANVLAWAATLIEGQPPAGATVVDPGQRAERDSFFGRPRASMFRRAA